MVAAKRLVPTMNPASPLRAACLIRNGDPTSAATSPIPWLNSVRDFFPLRLLTIGRCKQYTHAIFSCGLINDYKVSVYFYIRNSDLTTILEQCSPRHFILSHLYCSVTV